MTIRPATAADAAQIVAIYNHGIAERQATFETRPRSTDDVAEWLAARRPFLVATDGDAVLGFARVSAYSTRAAYAGVGEHTVYVSHTARGRGVGVALLNALADAATQAGYHKLTSRVFATNAASLALHRKAGFTEVGVQRRHAQLDGEWKDTVLVERLLGEAANYPLTP
ncbi:N-acetyltransferase [Solirubrobacter sp. CPCC 204708]|uniref:Arsinothricin resistance N-acetyltransferase ArsN1 n=1 Tax=Solirubrobacter deserti TaxID=2282478 RepID=A0ABT4RPL9_9ACTN|nr:arsinothricin resistance N-acetyltransferase ArsN1 family A [Solirubrobacter deserti]MBE2316603.1 N-acetyltransferase [Solirubrobacter deserti]MDA0140501.1 arsinothricin resistance N-acetyltransferase ArsN1 [Solirubrobacter deserti]